MNIIWRFYMDQERRWRWQQLGADRSLLAESRTGYREYEGCVADAKGMGYVFEPAQAKQLKAASR